MKNDALIITTWEEYERLVRDRLEQNKSVPGNFAKSKEESVWAALKDIPIPCENAPMVTLPLHIHIARGDFIGVTNLTAFDIEHTILVRVNELWKQAGIEFYMVDTTEHEWPAQVKDTTVMALQQQILCLTRDHSTGRMTGKDLRRTIFIDYLIGWDTLHNSISYNLWFFDMIGMESQGCCIDRYSRTIIMGRRSTKGYSVPTERPMHCLGKTCAHELGHALNLGHPRGKCFRDGTPCVSSTGRNNLMTGGEDETGGGGELLCPWQIWIARESATHFLATKFLAKHTKQGHGFFKSFFS